MKIYLISQSINVAYDTYDSAVVIAANKKSAQLMGPSEGDCADSSCWCKPEHVRVEFIGIARRTETKPRVVCASFNAG